METTKHNSLSIIANTLVGFDWMVIGGYNLMLQQIPYTTNDLDILTTKVGLTRLKEIFTGVITSGDNWEGYNFKVNHTQVESITEEGFDRQFYQQYLVPKYITQVLIGNSKIPCLNLKYQAAGYYHVHAAGKGSNDPTEKIILIASHYKTTINTLLGTE